MHLEPVLDTSFLWHTIHVNTLSKDHRMTPRPLTDKLSVAAQIDPRDFSAIAEAGFTTVISNRPDSEVEPHLSSASMAHQAAQAGVQYHYLPVVNGQLDPRQVERFREILETAPGPVLAYCRSGTRSAMVWALGQAGKRPAEEIVEAARQAGYDLTHLTAML